MDDDTAPLRHGCKTLHTALRRLAGAVDTAAPPSPSSSPPSSSSQPICCLRTQTGLNVPIGLMLGVMKPADFAPGKCPPDAFRPDVCFPVGDGPALLDAEGPSVVCWECGSLRRRVTKGLRFRNLLKTAEDFLCESGSFFATAVLLVAKSAEPCVIRGSGRRATGRTMKMPLTTQEGEINK